MSMPIVVRIKRRNGEIVQDCDVYIGRAVNRGGWKLKASKWKNPFSVKKYGREGAIEKYREYVLNNTSLMNSLHELQGKRLGCWCAPEPCHGDVLVELVKKYVLKSE